MNRRALEAICQTFAPGSEGVADAVLAAANKHLGPAERRQLSLLLGTFGRGFPLLSPARREAALRAWCDSRIPQRRAVFVALKQAALSFAYMRSESSWARERWEAIGYPGPTGTPADPPPRRIEPLRVERDLELDCDVCVVGSGAGGGVAAAVLAGAGLDVVVLEAGGYWSERDFDGAEDPGYDRLYLAGAAAATDDRGIGLIAGACLGGGTVVNYTTSFRAPDDILEEWAGHGFPSDELGGSLDAVCERIGVNTEHNEPSRRDELLASGLRSLRWHVEETPRNVLGCEQGRLCGSCGLGCPLGAKQSTLVTWLVDAQAAGARIVVDARAQRILVDAGEARGAVARSNGHDLHVRSRAVVVAAGALGTPPLLLRSGIRNENVGRWLRLHPGTPVLGVFDEEVRPWEGTLQALYSDQHRDLEDGYGVKYETVPVLPGFAAAALPWRSAAQHAALMDELAQTTNVGVLLRDRGSGRVTLGRDGSTRIRYRLSDDDLGRVRTGVDGAAQILEAAGARKILSGHSRVVSYEPGRRGDRAGFLRDSDAAGWGPGRCGFFSFHPLGSCRMGASPTNSAANPDGESWEARNLVVADGSTFPTASGVNPMVTIEAIAHLNAGKLAARLN
ncbi:MAG: GMC family oxidoreductase N-terminal domain-containing protein [Gaiellaceae bacterium MAG52_C11]|nr:GMC family oxidoreductase N-terminal domain-containing protein [Candidatus Gaiellasilicea maunaloa]